MLLKVSRYILAVTNTQTAWESIYSPAVFPKMYLRERERERETERQRKKETETETEKPWLFITFSIIITHIFPENFIEIPLVV